MNKYLLNYIYSNPIRLHKFMALMSEDFWIKKGDEKTLDLFKSAAAEISGYKDFLKKANIDPEKIKNISDFKRTVPATNKANYLRSYELNELCFGNVSDCYTSCNSGGSTGEPLYTLNSRQNMIKNKQGLLALLEYLWDFTAKKKKVLYVDAMALGMWTGGVIAEFITKNLALEYDYFSAVSPGADPERVVETLNKMAKHYDVIVIATYPSLFKSVLDKGDHTGFKWAKHDIKLVSVGELIDNLLHDHFISRLGRKDNNITRILDLYSGTEIGIPGYGLPVATKIKELARKNKNISRKIFGNENAEGSLFQTNPVNAYVESVDGNLLVSYSEKIPIMRYDIKDIGDTMSWSEVIKILEKEGVDIVAELKKDGFTKPLFKWPFITFLRRKDWAVTFYGAKIAPQSIQLLFAEDSRIYTFKLSERNSENDFRFTVNICLQPGTVMTRDEVHIMKKEYKAKVMDYLMRTNFDYKDAFDIDKKTLTPAIEVFEFQTGVFEGYYNKKPRLIEKK